MKYTLLHFGVFDINIIISLCLIEHYAMKLHGEVWIKLHIFFTSVHDGGVV